MCKMQKVFNFAHFIPKNTHISLYKNMQIYTTALQMNSNRAYIYIYIYTVTVHVKMIFFLLIFFLSPLSNYFSSSTSTTTSSFPNVYNNPGRQNKKEAENNHPTTKPSTTTQHCKLAHEINSKSMENQLENPTQNQDNPTGKLNSKSIKIHRETQPKIIMVTPQNHQNHSKSRSKFIKPIYKFI